MTIASLIAISVIFLLLAWTQIDDRCARSQSRA